MERRELEAFVLERYQRSPWTLDLVISAFLQALHSYRRSSVCAPFPNSMFTKDGEKDFIAAENATKYFRNIGRDIGLQSFGANNDGLVPESLNNVNPFALIPDESLKLLHWLLKFRYYVQLVMDPASELPALIADRLYGSHSLKAQQMGLLPDYILKLEEAEMAVFTTFDDVKSQFGSMLAFHGTSAENLHSILRCGLLNLSNSNLQRNGAIFGEGIYFSSDPAVALGFSKHGKGWDHSCFGRNAKYLLVCEVAKGDKVFCSDTSNSKSSSNKSKKNLGTYIVVQNSDLVKIRFLFVYGCSSKSRIAPKEDLPSSSMSSRVERINCCKLMIFLYAAILLTTAILNYFVFRKGVKHT